ncbi:hypothetical protein C4E04_19185 [Microvirga sp. 17 mud 1-3]|nr:hypothetical protein C4E04_19185 [Microvirga sp. 17 mud 1-3]
MRLGHSLDDEAIFNCSQAYWSGVKTTDIQLRSMGQPWSATPVEEVLFYGRLDFPNKDLSVND